MRLRFFSLVSAGIVSFFLVGCASVQEKKEGDMLQHRSPSTRPLKPGEKVTPPLKIGLLLPLSGTHQRLGRAFQQAAELSLFEGPSSANVVLIPRDTQGTRQGAQQAFLACLQEGVQGFLGPLFAFEVKAIQPLLKQAQKPLLTFSTDASVLGGGIFTLGFLPIPQVHYILEDASREGLKKIAAILPKGAYGTLMAQEIKKVAVEQDLSIEVIGTYDARRMRGALEAQGELRESVEALSRGAFQAVLIPEGGKTLEKILSTLYQAKLPDPLLLFLGTGQWEQNRTSVFPYFENAKIAAPSLEGYEAFQKRFSEIYGLPCPRIATLAYDAVALIKVLEQTPGQFSTQNLLDFSGFRGVDGRFRFLPNGHIERELSILTFSGGKLQTLKEAPTAF
jgi:branched-chain amino acid transport system substrate-binding protein